LKQNPTAQIAILQAAAERAGPQDRAFGTAAASTDGGATEQWERLIFAAVGGAAIFPGVPKHLGPLSHLFHGAVLQWTDLDLSLLALPGFANTANASKADSLSTREQVVLLVVSQYIGTAPQLADVQASQSRVHLAQALYDQRRTGRRRRQHTH